MRYTVIWVPAALNGLPGAWNHAPDQQAITDAADEIDRVLRLSPLSAGEEFGVDRRLVIEPLEVIYSVCPDDCMVRVLLASLVSTTS